MGSQRIQKIIASAGLSSRRRAEQLLEQERVKVNGQIAQLGDQADPEFDEICVDEVPVIYKPSVKVILINKPAGVITSCHDNQGRKTVLDLIPKVLRKGLHPVGRLDLFSRGAILLTNYGDLTLRLTHPRYAHEKTYLVWVKGSPSKLSLSKWRNGLILNGHLTMKTTIELLKSHQNKSQLRIILKEGRNRQIRRIAELLGHPVVDLQRTAIANINLKRLPEGSWRKIDRSEWMPMLNSKNHL